MYKRVGFRGLNTQNVDGIHTISSVSASNNACITALDFEQNNVTLIHVDNSVEEILEWSLICSAEFGLRQKNEMVGDFV